MFRPGFFFGAKKTATHFEEGHLVVVQVDGPEHDTTDASTAGVGHLGFERAHVLVGQQSPVGRAPQVRRLCLLVEHLNDRPIRHRVLHAKWPRNEREWNVPFRSLAS